MRHRAVTTVLLVVALIVGGLPAIASAQPSVQRQEARPPDPTDLDLLGAEPVEAAAPPSASPGGTWSASHVGAEPVDPTPVEELEDRRDATSRVFRNDDGSLTIDAYTVPVHYQTDDGWKPIDNQVTADPSRRGWVGTSANDWIVRFGPADEGVELVTPAGTVRMSPAAAGSPDPEGTDDTDPHRAGDRAPRGVAPQVASPPAPRRADRAEEALEEPATPDPSTVTYDEVWPGTDLEYKVTSSGLKEEIVLESADTAHEFSFDVTGTTLHVRDDGGLSLGGSLGEIFEVPPPRVSMADDEEATDASGVRFDVAPTDAGNGTTVTVAVDRDWLAGLPGEAFPVRIDPTFTLVQPDVAVTYDQNDEFVVGSPIGVGRFATLALTFRAALHFSHYEPFIGEGYRVYNAMLQFLGHTPSDPPIDVYDQGIFPFSFSQIGTDRPLVDGPWDGPFVTVTETMDRWVTEELEDQWFGVRGVESGDTFSQHEVRLVLAIYQPPEPSHVTNIATDEVLSTTTPTLHAAPVPYGDNGPDPGAPVWAEFQITTSPAPGTGQVLSSGMIQQPSETEGVSWQVPPGTLHEGVTYWGWVLTDFAQYGGPAPPTIPLPSSGVRFTVDLGLGDGGPSPTDEIGSVPARASAPSEGAPSPSLPGSKLTVNMVDGNLSVTMGTTTMGTLSGGLALQFTYNSLATGNEGLRAQFFNDTNGSGDIDAGDVMVADRVDPTVSFDWGTGVLAKAVAAQDPERALGRWTGLLTVPHSGTWQVGAISSDGLRVVVDDVERLDQWAPHEPQPAPGFGSSFSASPSQPLSLRVDWRNTDDFAVARVFLRDVSNPQDPVIYNLSPAWLSRTPADLPHGWTLNTAAGRARWVGLADRGTSVSVFDAGGSAHEFIATGDGYYAPPITAPNDLLTTGDDGRFVLEDAGGSVYTFRAEGTLESLVAATDDRNPAALVYGYAGDPVKLRTITDPVSGRDVELSYGGDSECGTVPPAATGLLCEITFWDGTSTELTYYETGELARITNPGSIVHDFGYDANGRLWQLRDPLTNDAIAAGVREDDFEALTLVFPDGEDRAWIVSQPAPEPDAPRPGRTYTYDPANRTTEVDVGGFDPATGFAERVRYDERNRIVERTGPDALAESYAWDEKDRLIATTDTAGLRTTTIYDPSSRPVAVHGPAPASSFQPDGTPAPGATVPTSTTVYDAGIDGLAAAYWANPFAAGAPALHGTGLGAGGDMDHDWGTTPPVTPGPGGWSARFHGLVDVPSSGDHTFEVATKGSVARVWVDDQLVAERDGPEPSDWVAETGDPVTLDAGRHRIRVDMVDTGGPAGLRVSWDGGAGLSPIPGPALGPNYGLVTSTTDPDGLVTANEYEDGAAGIGPHHGLETATIADPGGEVLRTEITYEAPGAGSFLRRVARTLPAGNTWETDNYGGTEGPLAATCGVAAGTPQGGFPKQVTGPDPDGGGPEPPRVEQYVYDEIGRAVGRRVGTTATVGTAGWECTSYDARGRMTSQSWPAFGDAPSRTVTHTYAVGGNPLVNEVTDSEWTPAPIRAAVDLLGRTVSYTDIWGRTTTTAFDQAGRRTHTEGFLGVISQDYDPATGRPAEVGATGVDLAVPAYDSAGRLSSVVHHNDVTSVHSYDTYGRPSGIGVIDEDGLTGDLVTRSLAGRVVDQEVFDGSGFVDAAPGGDNYVYDGAGRLVDANLPDASYTYGFGPAPGCTAPAAGNNTNRTSRQISGVGAGTTTSCYDHADRLVSTSELPAGEIVYDAHGNNVLLGDQLLDFDAADRHVRLETPDEVVRYERDPLDRIAERTESTRIDHVATASTAAVGSVATVNRPAGTEPGDVIVASVTATALLGLGTLSAPGWTLVRSESTLTAGTWVLYRYATDVDPPSWSFNVTLGLATTAALSTYRDVASEDPVSVSAVGTTALSTSHPLPRVTTTGDAAYLVHAVGLTGPAETTVPVGVTKRAGVSGVASLLVADRYQSRAGLSPGASATSTVGVESVAITVALEPARATVRYGHEGHGDVSSYSTDAEGQLVDLRIPLPGGGVYALVDGEFRFVHHNLHGDAVTVTDIDGNRVWTGYSGPFGEQPVGSAPTTSTEGTSFAWHGEDGRLADRGIVQMGARPYHPGHGRFLAVDPIEGGCANDYTYVHGDPINESDLSGLFGFDDLKKGLEGLGGLIKTGWDNTIGRAHGAACENEYVRSAADLAGFFGESNGNSLHNAAVKGATKAITSAGARFIRSLEKGVGFFEPATGVVKGVGRAFLGVTGVATFFNISCRN